MNKDQQNADSNLSLSKQRKIARKKEIEDAKKRKTRNKIIKITAYLVLMIGIISIISFNIYKFATKVKPSNNYSALLTENGFIKDVTASDLVTLCDYSNLEAPTSELEFSDESVDEEIQKLLDSKTTLNKETTETIVLNDSINIDYVGTVDGVVFEGGDTEGKGTKLLIGEGKYIDDFEDQLIGHKVGDKITIEVTFPADYETDLAGKDAVFEVTVNGIYQIPEFTDEFVAKNLSQYASTTDEYKSYLKESNYQKNLEAWVAQYLSDNSTISSYPKQYVKHLKSIAKHEALATYKSTNEFYQNYFGGPAYESFEKFTKMSEYKYDKSLTTKAKESLKNLLIYQAIVEKEGINITEEEYLSWKTSDEYDTQAYENDVAEYGKPYLMQNLIKQKALAIITGTILK